MARDAKGQLHARRPSSLADTFTEASQRWNKPWLRRSENHTLCH
jgi:hypothetical protein